MLKRNSFQERQPQNDKQPSEQQLIKRETELLTSVVTCSQVQVKANK